MKYLVIKGTVGSTKVDLTIDLPIAELLKNMPAVIRAVKDYMPEIMDATKELDEAGRTYLSK